MFVGHIGNPLLPLATSRFISCWPDINLCEFFSIFNISAILDSVVAHSNKNSISCMLWASSVWSNIGLYNLYNFYIHYSCCPWQQVFYTSESKQILSLRYQFVALSDNLSQRAHLAYFIYIYIYISYLCNSVLKFVSNSSSLESKGVMSGSGWNWVRITFCHSFYLYSDKFGIPTVYFCLYYLFW